MFTSCTDWLQEVDPAQSLPSGAAFSDAAGLETALVGAYDAIQSGPTDAGAQTGDFGGAGIAMNANILSDNAAWRGSFPSYIDMFNRQLTANNGEVGGLWRTAYVAINQANLVLQSLEGLDDPALTEDVAASLQGEALFIRGWSHFVLVRYFALPYGPSSGTDLGIPIMTTGVALGSDITFPVRNTVEEVYQQAIADLTTAAGLLEPTSPQGRVNSTAANAILADIAFQQRNYERAAEFANQVIDAGYMLTASPEEPFTAEGSSEEIWAVVSTAQDNPGVNGSLATFHHINGRGGDIVVSTDLRENGISRNYSRKSAKRCNC